MEALERETNAREALGTNVGHGSGSKRYNRDDAAAAAADDDEQLEEGGGDEDGEATGSSAAVSERLAAMKRDVEAKVWQICVG